MEKGAVGWGLRVRKHSRNPDVSSLREAGTMAERDRGRNAAVAKKMNYFSHPDFEVTL